MRQLLIRGFSELKSILRYLIAVVWVFFVVYQPPLPVSVIYLLTGVSFVYIGSSLLIEPKINKSFLKYMWVFGFLIIYLFIVTLLNKHEISNVSHVFWLMMCIFPTGYAISRFARKENKSFDYLYKIILSAALLQAFIAALAFFVPDIQTFLFKLLVQNNLYDEAHLIKWGFRIYGYGASLMYAIPIVQAVISGWSFIYGMRNGKPQYYLVSVFLLFTAVINAKVSAVVFVLIFLIGFVGVKKFTYKKLLSVAIIVVILYIGITVARDYLMSSNSRLLEWLGLLFDSSDINEMYLSYYADNTRWTLPDGLGFLFGIGATTDDYGIDADMGFINDVWLGGLVYLAVICYIIVRLVREIKKSSVYERDWKYYMIFSLVGTFIIADIKGLAFSYSSFMAFFVLVAMFGIDSPRREKR